MSRIISAVPMIFFASALCIGQMAAQTRPAVSSAAAGHGSFPVKVTKTLDSSKLKEGDAVALETTGSFKLPDGTLVPKGSKMVGHVTSAKARSKGDPESELVIALDKLDIVKGKELTVKGTVQAVFPPSEEADPGMPVTSSHQGGGGAGLSAGSVPPPDYKPTTDIKTGVATENTASVQPASDPKSTGVHGIHDLSLEDGVLRSKGKNVKLGSGVQLIVHVDIFG